LLSLFKTPGALLFINYYSIIFNLFTVNAVKDYPIYPFKF
jgi:hypothetical protein